MWKRKKSMRRLRHTLKIFRCVSYSLVSDASFCFEILSFFSVSKKRSFSLFTRNFIDSNRDCKWSFSMFFKLSMSLVIARTSLLAAIWLLRASSCSSCFLQIFTLSKSSSLARNSVSSSSSLDLFLPLLLNDDKSFRIPSNSCILWFWRAISSFLA